MPEPLVPHAIQVCFCGEGSMALPAEPLDAHGNGCLIWDWAMAKGKITPQQMLGKLAAYCGELGLSAEELEDA